MQFAVLTFVAVAHRRRRRVRADGAHPVEHPDDRVGQAVYAARDRRTRSIHPRRLRRVPFADGAAAARRDRQVRRLLEGRASSSTTIRSCGVRSGRVPICTASAASIRTPGTSCTCGSRRRPRRSRSCRAIRGCTTPARHRRTSRARSSPLRRLGVPYPDGYERQAPSDLAAQAARIADGLKPSGFNTSADREIVALIAYLQRLGTDIKSSPNAERRSPRRRSAAVVAGGQ